MAMNKRKYEADLKDRNSPTFTRCVELFRPSSKYIKKMVADGDPLTGNGLKYLIKLGILIILHFCI